MKKLIMMSIALLVPVVASGEFAVKFFPGWSYHHQDDEIHDGATLWAIIKQGDSYVLTERRISLKAVHSPIRDDEGQASGRELVAPDRESSIIHFIGIDGLEGGPVVFQKLRTTLVNTFNPQVPPSSVEFEIAGKVYTVFARLNEQNDMSVHMRHGDKTQLLCIYPKVDDALSSLQWAADIDRDDAPDLLISASGHYSYVDNRLYLSSAADPGDFVKEVGRYRDGE